MGETSGSNVRGTTIRGSGRHVVWVGLSVVGVFVDSSGIFCVLLNSVMVSCGRSKFCVIVSKVFCCRSRCAGREIWDHLVSVD